MDRKQLDVLVPMVYGLAVVLAALAFDSALVVVAVVGAILVGIYFAALRPRMIREAGEGRQRNRNRGR